MTDSFLAAAAARVADGVALSADLASRHLSPVARGGKPKPLSPAAHARPLRHVVAFKCAEFSPAKAQALGEALSALPALIRELGDFHFGPDMGLAADRPGHNVDYCITADFADEAAYAAFCRAPAWVKVVNGVIKPMLAPGEPIARVQFKIEHQSRARQSLMQADPPLFNVRFGKSMRDGDACDREPLREV